MKKIIYVLLALMLVTISSVTAWSWYYPSYSKCTESDGGKDFNVKGTVTYNYRTYTDYCSGNYLKEYYCSNYGVSSTYYRCPNGCSNGACIQPVYCGDGICNGVETCSSCETDCGVCPPVCGNGVIETGEECDDGNTQNGDGCSSTCQIDCKENWQCIYGLCVGSNYWSMYKTGTCVDLNICGTTYNKPPTKVKCSCINSWVQYQDELNIGDVVSESTHNLQDWGAIEPDTHGGNWGEHPTHSSCCPYGSIKAFDGNCRVVSDILSTDEATFTMDFGGYDNRYSSPSMELWVLKGISFDDDFDVYVDNVKVYSFDDDGTRSQWCNNEDWVKHTITNLPKGGVRTVKIVSTSPHWSLYDTYGQVAVSKVTTKWERTEEICS